MQVKPLAASTTTELASRKTVLSPPIEPQEKSVGWKMNQGKSSSKSTQEKLQTLQINRSDKTDKKIEQEITRSHVLPAKLPSRGVLDYVLNDKSTSRKAQETYYMKSSVRVGISRRDPCDLVYELHGDGEKHKLLFIMGLCMSKELWEPQVRYFSEQPGYQVCIVDNRGHGDSRASNFYGSTSTFAWDLYELLHHLRWDHVHIVGLSMGGMIAQELSVLIHQQRKIQATSIRLASLTLSATHAGGIFGYLIPLSGIPHMIRWMLSLTPYQRTHHLMPFCYSKSFLEENYDDLMRWHMDIYRNVHLKTLMSHLCAVFGHYVTYKRLNIIKEANTPTLIVTGTDDKLVRARNSSVLASALQTEYVVLEGCGHLLNCERAIEFNELIHQHVTRSTTDRKKNGKKKIANEKKEGNGSGLVSRLPATVKGIVTGVWNLMLLILFGLLSVFLNLFGGKRKQIAPPLPIPATNTATPTATVTPTSQSSPRPVAVVTERLSAEKSEEKSEVIHNLGEDCTWDVPPTQNPPRQRKEKNKTETVPANIHNNKHLNTQKGEQQEQKTEQKKKKRRRRK